MSSLKLENNIKLILLKSVSIYTFIIESHNNKLWFSINNVRSNSITIKNNRIIIANKAIIGLIKKAIHVLLVGTFKSVHINVNKLSIKDNNILLGNQEIKIPNDIFISISNKEALCWGLDKNELNKLTNIIKDEN